MKNQLILAIAISILAVSCKKENKNGVTNVEQIEAPMVKATAVDECYVYANEKDTISTQFRILDNSVTGKLSYKLYEKDKNEGTFQGTISGDTLIADYKFISEGKESVRQVVFLKMNETMIEGFGESVEKDGKMVFKDKKKLNFGSNIVLRKGDCK